MICMLLRFPSSTGNGSLRLFLLKFLHDVKTWDFQVFLHKKFSIKWWFETYSWRRCSRSPMELGTDPKKVLSERSLKKQRKKSLSVKIHVRDILERKLSSFQQDLQGVKVNYHTQFNWNRSTKSVWW